MAQRHRGQRRRGADGRDETAEGAGSRASLPAARLDVAAWACKGRSGMHRFAEIPVPMAIDPLRPIAPLVFSPDARRVLAVALTQTDDERIAPANDDEDVLLLLGCLNHLGLLDLAPGGYVASDFLRVQPWAPELHIQPFPG